jgi:UDP-glucose 4-epimerase
MDLRTIGKPVGTVLITGITGRVGSVLADVLYERGDDIVGLVAPDDPHADAFRAARPDVRLQCVDLRDGERVQHAVADAGATCVVHLAAQMVLQNATPEDLFDTNAMGTLRVLEGVRRRDPATHVVLASTDGTYGVARPSNGPFDELSPQLPGDYYSTSKVLAEDILRNFHAQYGTPFTILRFSTVLGPHEVLSRFRYEWALRLLRQAEMGRNTNLWPLFDEHTDMFRALTDQVPDAKRNPAVALTGPDGRPWGTPLVFVRDIVGGLLAAIDSVEPINAAVNVSAPATTAHDDGAATIARTLGLPQYTVTLPIRWYYEVSIDRARTQLGFTPQWTFDRMVEQALNGSPAEPVPRLTR